MITAFQIVRNSLAYPDFFSQASSIVSKNTKLNTEGYEKMIQKLEGDIRNHIRSEQQLKLYCENLLEKIEQKKTRYQDVKKSNKKLEENLNTKEKEMIELKTQILHYEEKALDYQQQLLEYK